MQLYTMTRITKRVLLATSLLLGRLCHVYGVAEYNQTLDEETKLCHGVTLSELTIKTTHALFAQERLTPHQLVECYMTRMMVLNPCYNAIVNLTPDLLKSTNSIDYKSIQRLPLAGIPILIDDGVKRRSLKSYSTSDDDDEEEEEENFDVIINYLKDSGAIILGEVQVDLPSIKRNKVTSIVCGKELASSPYDGKYQGEVNLEGGGSLRAIVNQLALAAVVPYASAGLKKTCVYGPLVCLKISSGVINGDTDSETSLGIISTNPLDSLAIFNVLVNNNKLYDIYLPRSADEEVFMERAILEALKGLKVGVTGSHSPDVKSDGQRIKYGFSDPLVKKLIDNGVTLIPLGNNKPTITTREQGVALIQEQLRKFTMTLLSYKLQDRQNFTQGIEVAELNISDILEYHKILLSNMAQFNVYGLPPAPPKRSATGGAPSKKKLSHYPSIRIVDERTAGAYSRAYARTTIRSQFAGNDLDLIMVPSGTSALTIRTGTVSGFPYITMPDLLNPNQPSGLTIMAPIGKEVLLLNLVNLLMSN